MSKESLDLLFCLGNSHAQNSALQPKIIATEMQRSTHGQVAKIGPYSWSLVLASTLDHALPA